MNNHITKELKCVSCKHLISDSEQKCKAFDLIPNDILAMEKNHTKVIDGQKGEYVYEKK